MRRHDKLLGGERQGGGGEAISGVCFLAAVCGDPLHKAQRALPLGRQLLMSRAWLRKQARNELAFVATPSTSVAVAQEAMLFELYEADHRRLPPKNKRR